MLQRLKPLLFRFTSPGKWLCTASPHLLVTETALNFICIRISRASLDAFFQFLTQAMNLYSHVLECSSKNTREEFPVRSYLILFEELTIFIAQLIQPPFHALELLTLDFDFRLCSERIT